MKKALYFALLAIVFASCSTLKPTNRITTTFLADYRPYSSADFFLSPDPYLGDFKPIGEIRIEIHPALVRPTSTSAPKYYDGLYIQPTGLVEEQIPMSDLLEAAVKEALDLGANGIANLKITTQESAVYTSRGKVVSTGKAVTKYVITGFCIIRK